MRVHGNAAEDKQHHVLLVHVDRDALDLVLRRDQARRAQVKASLFVHFANGAVEILFLLVDLPPWETPFGALLPALDQDGVSHFLIQHDGAADRDARLVLYKGLVRLFGMLGGEVGEKRAVGEHALGEDAQVHGRQARVERPDEIFVEPLRLLELEAYALHGLELFVGRVDDEADTQVI